AHVHEVAPQREEHPARAQGDGGVTDRTVGVPGDEGDVSLGEKTALLEGLPGKPTHPDGAALGLRQALADGLEILVSHNAETHGHQVGVVDGLTAPSPLTVFGRQVDELAGLEVPGAAVVAAHGL